MQWTLLETGPATAEENMLRDRSLLLDLHSQSTPTLHLYDWTYDAFTYGYFINPEDFFYLEQVKSAGLDTARRPTGGGIIFHTCDLAFSVLIPSSHPKFSLNTLENYAFINQAVVVAMRKFLGSHSFPQLLIREKNQGPSKVSRQFCMAKPTVYDVMIEGKKVGGAAQRRMKQGFLHQGSISLTLPDLNLLKKLLKDGENIVSLMQKNSFPLLGSSTISKEELKLARKEIQSLLKEALLNT